MVREAVKSSLKRFGWAHAAVEGVYKSEIPVMAAALSYRTIFGLIPVLVVGLVVLGAFSSEEQVGKTVRSVLAYSGLNEIAIDPNVVEEMGPPAPGTETIAAQRLDEWISSLVQRVRQIPFRTIGFIGLVALIYAAMSMLVEVERAFNHVYRAPSGRRWSSRIVRYWTMLTLGTLLLCATFYVSERVSGWAGHFAGRLSGVEVAELTEPIPEAGLATAQPGSAVKAVGFVITVIISTALLMVLFVTVPNAPVQFRAALVGASLGAVAWEAGKWAFTQYVHFSANYAQFYGTIGLIPLFMLWVYVTWIIVLTGLYVSYLVQTYKNRPIQEAVAAASRPSIVDPASILAVVGAVSDRFGRGVAADAAELAQQTGIDASAVTVMLEQLAQAGLVHRVTDSSQRQGFALARPAASIPAAELLRIGQALASVGGEPAYLTSGALAPLLRQLDAIRLEALHGKTFEDVVGRSPAEHNGSAPSPVSPPTRMAAPAEIDGGSAKDQQSWV